MAMLQATADGNVAEDHHRVLLGMPSGSPRTHGRAPEAGATVPLDDFK